MKTITIWKLGDHRHTNGNSNLPALPTQDTLTKFKAALEEAYKTGTLVWDSMLEVQQIEIPDENNAIEKHIFDLLDEGVELNFNFDK